ncbi:MAG: dihydrolipoamide acyltransferase [Candidatus Nitrotoga sp.]|nr:dihydrolipoamide acyltransferase [Candidatus Nitrotoga sp.]
MSIIPKKSWVLLTMILVTLNACSTIPANQPPPIVILPPQPLAITPSQLEVLMQYYEYIRKMPATELVKEHDKAKQNLILAKSDTTRAELALLLILPNTSFRDTGAALNLLNDFPKDTKLPTSMRSFKHLLSALLAEQQRINSSVNELSQKLKEEQKHSEVLKNQIDDIKNMERNLILRDKP